ncbi:MAG: dipeptidyl aminopeptidase/acylaminoacyl peptidase [Gammaproteobacteria bacterium]|jgi:dipeptidyl aminopeptidase/acylaminoacyl peptidase
MSNKGYAVVRPNVRGSAGCGYELSQAQMQKWGLEMQDDITDASTHFITKGLIDKSKVCIFGRSYGGYAALMATTKTPILLMHGNEDRTARVRQSQLILSPLMRNS